MQAEAIKAAPVSSSSSSAAAAAAAATAVVTVPGDVADPRVSAHAFKTHMATHGRSEDVDRGCGYGCGLHAGSEGSDMGCGCGSHAGPEDVDRGCGCGLHALP
eukprot:scaffold139052_cov21-Tisochrysis_lutea.AAC.3